MVDNNIAITRYGTKKVEFDGSTLYIRGYRMKQAKNIHEFLKDRIDDCQPIFLENYSYREVMKILAVVGKYGRP